MNGNHIISILFYFAVQWHCVALGGYGDPEPDFPAHPNHQERSVLTLVNACRMAPVVFRDHFLQVSGILLPQNYPAVDPVYWNGNLNRAARNHASDMAQNCGLQHNSCDGTSWSARIRQYYNSNGLAENIAYGYDNAQKAMASWILDGSADNPAPDGAQPTQQWPSGDGHRSAIMNGAFSEAGAGYAVGPQGWRDENHYWVIDFGTNGSEYDSKIPAATHLFVHPSSVMFMANYFDADGRAPVHADVIVEGSEYPLETVLGGEWRGTYSTQLSRGEQCRSYFFRFIDEDGEQHRYPQQGNLVTLGEGECTESYEKLSEVSLKKTDKPVGAVSLQFSRKMGRKKLYDIAGRRIVSNEAPQGILLEVSTDQRGHSLVRKKMRIR